MHPLFRALDLLRAPVPHEKQRLLRARWDSLDVHWRTPGQGFGQQATGCGATLGVHPRCDFACTGCYLGADANRVRLSDWIRRLSSSTSFERGWARKGMYKSQTARSHCYQSRTSSRFFNMRGALVSCRW